MKRDEEKIKKMREAAVICSDIFQQIIKLAKEGAPLMEVDALAESLCYKNKVKPAFKGYEGFPSTICVSPNDVVVHGIPDELKLEEGDLLAVDMGIKYKDVYSDMAITFPIGGSYREASTQVFADTVKAAVLAGIEAARVGNKVGDIGHAMQTIVEKGGYSVVKEMVGHGIGYELHEDPYIPGFGKPNTGEKLYDGQTIAVEAIINEGTDEIVMDADDGWTTYTNDGKLSAIFEHTIVVGEKPEILTKW
jgi:methionyl aminopeptidase